MDRDTATEKVSGLLKLAQDVAKEIGGRADVSKEIKDAGKHYVSVTRGGKSPHMRNIHVVLTEDQDRNVTYNNISEEGAVATKTIVSKNSPQDIQEKYGLYGLKMDTASWYK